MPLLLPLLGKHGLWVCETQIGAAHSELLCVCVYIHFKSQPAPGPRALKMSATGISVSLMWRELCKL